MDDNRFTTEMTILLGLHNDLRDLYRQPMYALDYIRNNNATPGIDRPCRKLFLCITIISHSANALKHIELALARFPKCGDHFFL